MKSKKFFAVIATSVLLCSFVTGCKQNTQPKSFTTLTKEVLERQDYEKGTVIVFLTHDVSKKIVNGKINYESVFKGIETDSIKCPSETTIENYKNDNDESFGYTLHYDLHLKDKSDENLLDVINQLRSKKEIQTAEPNYISHLEEYKTNDTHIAKQWCFDDNDGVDIADHLTAGFGSNSIKVGVIDNGVYSHEDFGLASYVSNRATTPYTDHGTHVSGIIGARSNNSLGIAGVSRNVLIVPFNVGSGGTSINSSAAVEALEYISDLWNTNNRISVVNYSVSGYGSNTSILNAIKNYKGLFVWSAGNNHAYYSENDVGNFFNTNNLISVGSFTRNHFISSFSAFGEGVHMFAPGSNIYSCVGTNSYDYKSGTSMAAPHVTGAASLILTKYPKATGRDLKQILIDSSIDGIRNHEDLRIENPDGTVTYQSFHQTYGRKLSVDRALDFADTYFDTHAIDFDVVSKDGNNYTIDIVNKSNKSRKVSYNLKTTSLSNAKNFKNLKNLETATVYSNSTKRIVVTKDGSNEYAVASYYENGNRFVAYADGLTDKGCNPIQYNDKYNVRHRFPTSVSSASYLKFYIVSSSGFIFLDWKVKIINTNSKAVQVTYNKKMCFSQDAQSFSGLNDTQTITLASREEREVTIGANVFADTIVAAVEFVNTFGLDCRKITSSHGFSKGQTVTGDQNTILYADQ